MRYRALLMDNRACYPEALYSSSIDSMFTLEKSQLGTRTVHGDWAERSGD